MKTQFNQSTHTQVNLLNNTPNTRFFETKSHWCTSTAVAVCSKTYGTAVRSEHLVTCFDSVPKCPCNTEVD